MMRLMFGVALCAFSLMSASTAEAGPYGHGRPGHRHGSPYYRSHGVRYGSSYYYSGRGHSHWGHRRWDPTFSRYHYYDPYLSCYYYYDDGRCGYYPVLYGR